MLYIASTVHFFLTLLLFRILHALLPVIANTVNVMSRAGSELEYLVLLLFKMVMLLSQ